MVLEILGIPRFIDNGGSHFTEEWNKAGMYVHGSYRPKKRESDPIARSNLVLSLSKSGGVFEGLHKGLYLKAARGHPTLNRGAPGGCDDVSLVTEHVGRPTHANLVGAVRIMFIPPRIVRVLVKLTRLDVGLGDERLSPRWTLDPTLLAVVECAGMPVKLVHDTIVLGPRSPSKQVHDFHRIIVIRRVK
jgi:hypothetical protein